MGTASSVFKQVIRSRFPGKVENAIQNPKGTPRMVVRKVEVPLTRRETPTMESTSGSRLSTNNAAENRLSNKNSIRNKNGVLEYWSIGVLE